MLADSFVLDRGGVIGLPRHVALWDTLACPMLRRTDVVYYRQQTRLDEARPPKPLWHPRPPLRRLKPLPPRSLGPPRFERSRRAEVDCPGGPSSGSDRSSWGSSPS